MTSCFRELTVVNSGESVERSVPDFNSSPAQERGAAAPLHATYSAASENFGELFRQVEENREVVVIHRRGHEDVALVCLDELVSLLESARLLRSPANASRLLGALREVIEARQGDVG